MLTKLEIGKATKDISKGQLKGIRQGFIPLLTIDCIDKIIPVKQKFTSLKCKSKNQTAWIICLNKRPILCQIQNYEGNIIIPHLKVLHTIPNMFPIIRVDKGAIRFMIAGANIMVPGIIKDKTYNFEKQVLVGVYCEGKQHAVGIGLSKLSSQQLENEQKGLAIQMLHFLGDDFWKFDFK